ncbi:fasciclin domain-containing protein [Phycicoccus sp. MAQZ13P-2]|uniref:fasciclin domain-containing protein n=1 Tax=Phycicoccus mangrovi TaxID=2840470 RepID=UPI001C008D15|nr:fasciclin domain-containing protein [Phycicoccus mangrovi]MBT9254268.1 fasciclin domain-containing protein [Phycicoccus mangrovi]MBT9272646.1 fasciclin domain-containing protein [Phycicoccus mangrovi]
MRRTLAATAALSLALVVSACGSDSDTDAGASTPATSSAAPTSASPSASESAAASADIVDTAVAAGNFTTLATALEAAGLVETLKGEGPYTVFAPTDEAFTALPAGTLDDLLADPQGALTDVLTYHVVPGKVMAADVATMDGQEVETVNGDTLTVGVDGDTVTLTDTSGGEVTVTQTDIEATNGVIHVIDGVLVPKG